MSSAVRTLLLALLATAVVVGVGVVLTRDDEPEEAAPPAPSAPPTVPSTPLAEYDTATVAVLRTAFCDAVAPEALERALGTAPTKSGAYDDGQPAALAPGVRDVAHEYGCTWRSPGTPRATVARAWVFAPPVVPADGRRLARAAREREGCTAVPDAPAFGQPSAAVTCTDGPTTEISFRGLFGDAWLTCSLSGALAGAEGLDRAGRWCVAVAQAASSVEPESARSSGTS